MVTSSYEWDEKTETKKNEQLLYKGNIVAINN